MTTKKTMRPVTSDTGFDPKALPPQDPALKVQFLNDDGPVADVGVMYLHCKRCMEEWKAGAGKGESPKAYARQQVAWTREGFQVWCVRHDANIVNVTARAVRKAVTP